MPPQRPLVPAVIELPMALTMPLLMAWTSASIAKTANGPSPTNSATTKCVMSGIRMGDATASAMGLPRWGVIRYRLLYQ